MINLIWYRGNNVIYFANSKFNYGTVRNSLPVNNIKVNDQTPQHTFSAVWYKVDGSYLESVQKKIPAKGTRIGFKLKNQELASDKIPVYLTEEQVNPYFDEDYGEKWKNYSDFQSLYEADVSYSEESWVDEEINATYLGQINVEENEWLPNIKFNVLADSQWAHKEIKQIDLTSIIRYEELEKMLVPEFLLHKRPCSLSSTQTYEIVRQYVKENIDPKQAVVTSDYAFCFTVKKKVAIKPYIHTWEEKKPNGKSYTRPRIKNRTIEWKEVEIFEMTNEKDKYKKYTPIKGFSGDSLEDLIENIKLYLDELMYNINVPVHECEHCNGTGYLIDNNFEINKR